MTSVLHYLRFSSAAQAEGDSVRRQRELAQRYCAPRGLTICREVCDMGVSAYRGDNLATFDSLASEVQQGTLARGSILLVENLDRFSREGLGTSLYALLTLVKAGIVVIDLTKQVSYDETTIDDLSTVILSSAELTRANEESARKSNLVRSARDAARAKQNRAQFAWPGWLRKSGDRFEPIPELVSSVISVFEFVAAGHGAKATAVRANAEGWPVPSKRPASGWHHSLVRRLIRSPSVLGQYEFNLLQNGKRIPTGQVVDDWYPPVVSTELFHRANESMNSREFARGRHSCDGLNPFRGLLRCGSCGESYSLHPGQYPSYYCRGRDRGVCNSPAVAHRLLLAAVIPKLVHAWAESFDSTHLRDKYSIQLSQLDEQLANIAVRVRNLNEAIELAAGDIPSLIPRLRDLTVKQRQLTTARAGVVASLESVPASVHLDADVVLRAYLREPDEAVRAEFSSRARQLILRGLVFPGAAVALRIHELPVPLVVPLADHRDRHDIGRYMELLATPMSLLSDDALKLRSDV